MRTALAGVAAMAVLTTGLITGLTTGLVTAAVTTAAPAAATPAGQPRAHTAARPAVAASTLPATRRAWAKARFARETVRYGDQDASPSAIEHVRELQYRLTWAGSYDGPVTGYFGDLTKAAVKRYQRSIRLTASGVADTATWRHLIPATVRGRKHIPDSCADGSGWDACYDRTRHEVTVWRDGKLRNAWLVRGGGSDTPTRTGDFSVYYRDIDHVSGLYDSPMPYSQFFSGGEAFHGSGTMVDPFTGHSHGCINMYVEDARQLWKLTAKAPLGVHVHGAWS
jgi:Putative peptidoglycan binding domain/L,D-transpeptidase catalytic domain